MSNANDAVQDDLLVKATDRLRKAHGSEVPPGLVASVVDSLPPGPHAGTRRQRPARAAVRMGSLAASLVAMVIVAALMMPGGTGVALAQILDKVKEAQSVKFVFSPGSVDDPNKELKCVLLRERLRVEHPSGIVLTSDRKTKEGLYLDAKNKTAAQFPLPEQVSLELAADPLTQLREVGGKSAERIGKEVVDGHESEVLRVPGIKLFGTESEKGEMRVWVDSSSMLPLRLELRMGQSTLMTFRKIEWNPDVDPELVSMEIPSGYREQPVEVFRKLLHPDRDRDQRLTPAEAFRKWQDGNK